MTRRLLVTLVSAALLAGACSSSARPTVAPEAPGVDRQAPASVLRIALVEPADLDPAHQRLSSPSAMIAMDLLLDGLTAVDAETGAVVPALAHSWRVSADGLRWRFELATDDRGRPLVTPADVAWTLSRTARLGEASLTGSALQQVRGYDEMVAGDEVRIDGVEAADGAVVIHLVRPFPALPAVLAHPTMGILPDGDVEAPISVRRSSSAFAVTETDRGLSLVARDRFGGTVDRVSVVWVDDEAAAVSAVVAGRADVAPVGRGQVGIANHEVAGPVGSTLFFGLNAGHPALSDPGLRRAIVQGVDRRALATAGRIRPFDGLLPGGEGCGDGCVHDPRLATQLVEFVSGDDEVPTVAVDHLAGNGADEAMAAQIVADLTAIGIRAEARPGSVEQLEARIAAGDHQVFRYGWVAPYADPQAWLESLFASDGLDNVFALMDAEVDAALADLGVAPVADRADVAATAEAAVLREHVVVPVGGRPWRVAHGAGVDGVVVRADGTFDLERVSVD